MTETGFEAYCEAAAAFFTDAAFLTGELLTGDCDYLTGEGDAFLLDLTGDAVLTGEGDAAACLEGDAFERETREGEALAGDERSLLLDGLLTAEAFF